MARKTKEDTQRTKDAILDAAEAVFMQNGVGATTMSDLADAAGVSRGAIYGHYPNKTEVCIAMCIRALSPLKLAEPEKGTSAMVQIQEMLYKFLRIYGESGSAQRVMEILHLKCEDCEENQPIIKFREDWKERSRVKMKTLFELAVAQGELPVNFNIPLGLGFVRALMVGACDTLIWSGEGKKRLWKDGECFIRAGLFGMCNSECMLD